MLKLGVHTPLKGKILYKVEWKPIKGYEGMYEISNNGKVRNGKDIIRRSFAIISFEETMFEIASIPKAPEAIKTLKTKSKMYKINVIIPEVLVAPFFIISPCFNNYF